MLVLFLSFVEDRIVAQSYENLLVYAEFQRKHESIYKNVKLFLFINLVHRLLPLFLCSIGSFACHVEK